MLELSASINANCQFWLVDGGYTTWGAWTTCTTTCGVGTHMRFRSCTQPSPQNLGKSCTDPANPNGFGPDVQTESCNSGSCQGIMVKFIQLTIKNLTIKLYCYVMHIHISLSCNASVLPKFRKVKVIV